MEHVSVSKASLVNSVSYKEVSILPYSVHEQGFTGELCELQKGNVSMDDTWLTQ